MGKCPKCGIELGKDEMIHWECSSCNCKLSWKLEDFTRSIYKRQHRTNPQINSNSSANSSVKTKNNTSIIFSIILALSLLGNGFLFYQFNSTQQKLSQNIVDNTNQEVVLLNSQLKKSQDNIINLQTQYNELKQSNQDLNKDYQTVCQSLSNCKKSLIKRQEKINILSTRIIRKDVKISDLRGKVSGLQTKNRSLQSKLYTKNNSSTSSYKTNSYTVYVTDYGEKYHRAGCRYLWNSSSAMSLSSAKAAGYTPCSVCNP